MRVLNFFDIVTDLTRDIVMLRRYRNAVVMCTGKIVLGCGDNFTIKTTHCELHKSLNSKKTLLSAETPAGPGKINVVWKTPHRAMRRLCACT